MHHPGFWRVKYLHSVELGLNYEKVDWNWNELSHTEENAYTLSGQFEREKAATTLGCRIKTHQSIL